MIAGLSDVQAKLWRSFRETVDTIVAPHAASIDASQAFPVGLVDELGDAGFLSALSPPEWGGGGLDLTSYGLLSEELGRTCSNVRNFVAVQDMVSQSIERWGNEQQRRRWLRPLAAGQVIAAFALTEPGVGSDASAITTEARRDGSEIVLAGTKKWISFGQSAELLLVFAQLEGRHTAFLVEAQTPGIRVDPLNDLLGLSGSMLAEITFDGCRVPCESMVGLAGSGLVFVASSALTLGRLSTAWGCVGLAQACLDESTAYATDRRQFGKPLADHQLVQQILADMITESRAARLLCWQAGLATERDDADAMEQTLAAKYYASTAAARIATNAVQVQGARGMGAGSTVARLFRDAKAMEVIEGSTQVIQQLIGGWSVNARHPASATVGDR